MKTLLFTVQLILVALGMPLTAHAVLTQLDSSSFAWKYEMDADPTTQDLDSNGHVDWLWLGGTGTHTIAGGVLTFVDPKNTGIDSEGAGYLTPAHFSGTADYTIEYALHVQAGALTMNWNNGGNTWREAITTEAGGMFITTNGPVNHFSGALNSDGYHTIRLAFTGADHTAHVYRDGVLVVEEANITNVGGGAQWTQFGGSGNDGGTVDIDYVRITPGAYAPVPEPATFALLAIGLMGLGCYGWRNRK